LQDGQSVLNRRQDDEVWLMLAFPNQGSEYVETHDDAAIRRGDQRRYVFGDRQRTDCYHRGASHPNPMQRRQKLRHIPE
jgi:hypothetical protein